MKLNILIHGNNTECNTAMMKIPVYINAKIPTLMQPILMHHKCCFLCMAYACPYNRQSSHVSFNVTVTSYIWDTQILDLLMETTSPYEGHTSCSSFLQLLHLTSGLLHHMSGLPKILHWLHLTLLTMLALWGAPYKQPRQDGTPRSTPTYYPRCMCVRPLLVYYPKMGSDTFLSKT